MDSRKMEFDVFELVMTDVSKLMFVWEACIIGVTCT
jgi:hypothetical protein